MIHCTQFPVHRLERVDPQLGASRQPHTVITNNLTHHVKWSHYVSFFVSGTRLSPARHSSQSYGRLLYLSAVRALLSELEISKSVHSRSAGKLRAGLHQPK